MNCLTIKYNTKKRNRLAQEERTEKYVSRQTTTKWEKSVISSNLKYLIDLSHIFGITIDHLMKEDDYFTEKIKTLIQINSLMLAKIKIIYDEFN